MKKYLYKFWDYIRSPFKPSPRIRLISAISLIASIIFSVSPSNCNGQGWRKYKSEVRVNDIGNDFEVISALGYYPLHEHDTLRYYIYRKEDSTGFRTDPIWQDVLVCPNGDLKKLFFAGGDLPSFIRGTYEDENADVYLWGNRGPDYYVYKYDKWNTRKITLLFKVPGMADIAGDICGLFKIKPRKALVQVYVYPDSWKPVKLKPTEREGIWKVAKQ